MKTELIRGKYLTILGGSFLYAIFYAFCRSDNPSGMATVLGVVATLGIIWFFAHTLEISFGKHVVFYAIPILALSISTVLTDDGFLHFWNGVGIFLLLISMILHQIYEDANWSFGAYAKNMLSAIGGSLGASFEMFTDGIAWNQKKEKEKYQPLFYGIAGTLMGLPILFIVGALLTTSDVVILDYFVETFRDLDFSKVCRFLLWVLFIFFITYGATKYVSKEKVMAVGEDKRKKNPAFVIGLTVWLAVMYVVYSVIQVVYLFWGGMELPGDYTYAEYAREGFFQLLVVCAFNLFLILISIGFFRKSKVLNGILVCISGCTYIMLFSAGMRMIMYIRFYYMTYLRIMVLWGLVLIFFLLTGAIIAIFKDEFRLFQYGMIVVTCCYMVLSFGKPDYWIGTINCANIKSVQSDFFLGETYNDTWYLRSLSLDAIEAVEPIMSEIFVDDIDYGSENWYEKCYAKIEDMGIREFNVSIMQAKNIVSHE